MNAEEVHVDLGPISLFDARATHLALQVAIDAGYFTDANNYAAVCAVKALLRHRIAQAERKAAA